jgi:Bifunctional DNA primase/polymerase, N-terminal
VSALDAALAWAGRGHPVLPVREVREPDGAYRKVPLTEHGKDDATTDPDQIRLWFRRWPDALCAVRLDRLLLIDRDSPEAEVRWQTLREEHATAPEETAEAATHRGRHAYFAANGTRPDRASGKLAAWA